MPLESTALTALDAWGIGYLGLQPWLKSHSASRLASPCRRSQRRPRYSSLFHDTFEVREIVPCHFGERCRFDARSQPHGNLGRPIGEWLEQNDTTRKNVRDCLPRNSPLRNTEQDLQNGPVFFAAYPRSEREMGFVDFLNISQRRHESRQLFEARAVGVNVRHGSVQDDRIDLAVRIEWRGLFFTSVRLAAGGIDVGSVWFHVAIQG
jgi:hypothetical protein